jgi:acyl-CoA synthetase (AMP-forming)/AMP-acid ligase II
MRAFVAKNFQGSFMNTMIPVQSPLDNANSIVDCLEFYAQTQKDQRAYTFLVNGEDQERVLSYGELRERAFEFGKFLRSQGLTDKTVLLLFPAGLDFIVAFFACAYAGAISVPANLARNSHHFNRLKKIIQDAQCPAVLSSAELKPILYQGLFGDQLDVPLKAQKQEYVTSKIQILCELDIVKSNASTDNQLILPSPNQLAFLQYTSGSTGEPKGVMISHAQLIANEKAIRHSANLPEHLIGAGWLPQFHDMGLIGATLQPVALGGHYIFMSPLHFLQRPLRWLNMISQYRANATAAPNFALDLCIKAYKDSERENLDLTSLSTIFCGAEPVNASTVEQFETLFEKFGLRKNTIKPCYGLAEATLMISGGSSAHHERKLNLNRTKFAAGKIQILKNDLSLPDHTIQTIVCCGKAIPDHQTIIVNPNTGAVLGESEIGEIWFSGPSMASGYWRNSRASQLHFQAFTPCGQGPFLRTGDLGFFHNQGLYITGRIKDLIIFRGRNLYPHDLESTIVNSLASVCNIHAAIFAVEEEPGSSRQVSINAYIELPRRSKDLPDFKTLTRNIKAAINQNHEVTLRDVFFLSHGKIPRTSSGKTQRHRCAEMYSSREIDQQEHLLFSTRERSNASLEAIA